MSYIKKCQREKIPPNNQEMLPIWGTFKTQSKISLFDVLSKHGIESVMVPNNMTPLLQPVDLTTNASLKKMGKGALSEYFSSSVMEALKKDLTKDII